MAKQLVVCNVVSAGAQKGTLRFFDVSSSTAKSVEISETDPGIEAERFQKHLEEISEEIRVDIEQLEQQAKKEEAEIMRAHVAILHDSSFHERVRQAIQEMKYFTEDAIAHVTGELADLFSQSEDPVFRERAVDFRDLANRFRKHLARHREGMVEEQERFIEDSVTALPELLPSQVIAASMQKGQAFIVESGTEFAHAAIIAKSFGIPVVRVKSIGDLEEYTGSLVLVDAYREQILIEPSENDLASVVNFSADITSRNDLPLRLWLNVTDPEQIRNFNWQGVEGVGLYRTETLFMQKQHDFPTEEEQLSVYEALFSLCEERPVTVRTADLGGDKPMEHMTMGGQENPQLGLRGTRLYRYHPEILITQLRAILRAAHLLKELRIMFPLVETIEVWRFLQDIIAQALSSLEEDGLTFRRQFQKGILIETPASVLCADILIESADFLCVGTNDLVQYLFAVDRNNANMGFLYQPHHPIMLRVLRELQQRAVKANKTMKLCGEIAGDARLLPLLAGLGIEDLSVSLGALAKVRQGLGSLDLDKCRNLADLALRAETGDEVQVLLDRWHGSAASKGQSSDSYLDPVCKMKVAPDSTSFSLEINGQQYYFCSRRCRDIFLRRNNEAQS